MDSTLRSAHAPQNPAQPFSATSTLAPSPLTNTLTQSSNPFDLSSKPTTRAFTAPLQPTSAGIPQAAMSQAQPLSQALNDSSHCVGLPVTIQNENPGAVPLSEAVSANQAATTCYSHQVEGLGGPTATAPFLQDFSLVAEAAKRAQMGIVMRDLESVTL
ncbi:hypothetical protein N7476_011522 [Penicillium atrosanguineum]|uniref:Uncharacterized protein n=1 Tax=Penicillium atrosanguineum TaxID=1132637 RepID=A0A9W9PMS7_9EURO|nr:hypothetical protein N7476_011522 [Penicillium atrosanguineum]